MESNKIIRWAILGAGNIARSFVKDFELMKDARLVAVAAGEPERAKNFAATHNIPMALSYDELYNSNEIDAVYIATTHNFHHQQALHCLKKGKAVLCEKPVTVNDTQFKELAALSKANHTFLMEAMWTYFLPAVQKAKQWVNEGRIGKIKVVQADFAFPMEKKMEGRMYSPHLAGGSLLDLGIYPVAMAYYFTDSIPDKIIASGVLTPTGVDAQVGMLLQFGDINASLFTSMVTRMTNKCRLFGESGYIELPDFWRTNQCSIYDKDYALIESYNDQRTSHGFIYQMQHANDMIRAGNTESPVIPHARSNNMQETLTAVRNQIGLRYPFE
jgi:predicted dehydrogenase